MEQIKTEFESTLPRLVRRDASQVLMVDGEPFVMLAGEVHNSCSSSPKTLAAAFDKAVALGMNSVVIPATWELIEPEEGAFDFSTVDFALSLARERGLRLELLWFGAWKNGQCYYAPEWVKCDLDRFERAEPETGQRQIIVMGGLSYSALSLFCPATREADAKAFASLMGHLREVDGGEHTVLCVQVENECGLMGAGREHSPAADEAFARDVPQDLVQALRDSHDTLAPDVAAALDAGAGEGSWEEVFGPVAEELFSAYHMASYVEAVAAAGKRAYPLPLTANCWLDKGGEPGSYPTGGPVARVMEVWKYVAPSIDVIAPDIYVPAFCDVCDAYRKLDNPLFIPETSTHSYAAPREIWAVGHHHALCYSPFGFEDIGDSSVTPLSAMLGVDTSDPALSTTQDADEYAQVTTLLGQLLAYVPDVLGTSRMEAISSERPGGGTIAFGTSGVYAHFFGTMPGACLAVSVAEDEFFVLGLRCMLKPISVDSARPHADIVVLEDGSFVDGEWVADRRLNGDEACIISCSQPRILHFKLFLYD